MHSGSLQVQPGCAGHQCGHTLQKLSATALMQIATGPNRPQNLREVLRSPRLQPARFFKLIMSRSSRQPTKAGMDSVVESVRGRRRRANEQLEEPAKVTEPAEAVEAQDAEPAKPKRQKTAGKESKRASAGATREKEQQLAKQGYHCVAGVDEAGRGPLAGPVVAAACYVPPEVDIPGVADSKQLDEAERERLYDIIINTPGVLWAAEVVDHVTIDRINILQATMTAMSAAARQLAADKLDYLLVDGNRLPKDLPVPGQAVIQGDSHCFCIAAASIIAKVTRDRLMLKAHELYPQYNFAQHKGYAVPEHYQALAAHGPCEIHRRSFQPIRGMTGWTREAQLAAEAAAAGVGAGGAADDTGADTTQGEVVAAAAGGKKRASKAGGRGKGQTGSKGRGRGKSVVAVDEARDDEQQQGVEQDAAPAPAKRKQRTKAK